MTANKEGAFSPPPPDAPQETTRAGSERPTQDQIAAAQAHERDLPAYAPKPMTREQIRTLIGKDPEAVVLSARDQARQATSSVKPPDAPLPSRLRRVMRPAATADPSTDATKKIVLTDMIDEMNKITRQVSEAASAEPPASIKNAPIEPVLVYTPLPPPEPHQKAASNTDSPSRGIPTATADPNKQITGGFGVPGEGPADYFPLDGTEVRAVAEQCMDELYARIQDDLRFSIACTYPRVSVRVEIIIEAYGQDKPTVIPRVATPHTKTMIETARAHADEVVFVVAADRTEMTADGKSITPPNQMRQDLGLEVPRKQRIQTPSGGSMWIDTTRTS